MKKISIIIPAYNAEKYLENCYKSILAQSYQNFEVITVNDESKDNTLAIMKKYSKLDARFIAIDMPHGGVSKARNTGFLQSTGYYIQFVDADDTLNPKMLEKMICLIEHNNTDLAICRFNHPYFKTYCENKVFDMSTKKDFMELFQDTFALTVPWNKVWKRSCFKAGFDESVRFSEDELCNLANLVNVKKVVTTNEYLYNYYVDPNNSQSCISGIVRTKDFWKNKTSIYFLGSQLVKKRKEILSAAIENKQIPVSDINFISYIRALDYYFAQLPVYIGIGVSKKALVEDCLTTIDDINFKCAFKAERNYGVKLNYATKETKRFFAEKFIEGCLVLCNEKFGDESFKLSNAVRMMFLACFAQTGQSLNVESLNAKLFKEYILGSSYEATYVRGILDYGSVPNYNSTIVWNNSFAEYASV